MRFAMTLPPFHICDALPIASIGLAFAAIGDVVADATRIDRESLIPLGLSVAAIATTAAFVYWFATDRAETRAEQKRLAQQAKATHDLLTMICESLPDVDENHWKIKQLLRDSEAGAE